MQISEANYWDQIYSGQLNKEPGGQCSFDRYKPIMDNIGGSRTIIDVGAGYGNLVKRIMKEHQTCEVWGCDFSVEASKRSGLKNYVVCPANNIPFPNKFFDLSICSQTLEYINDNKAVIKELKRISNRAILTVTAGKHQTCSQLREYDLKGFVDMCFEFGKVEIGIQISSMIFVRIKFND